MQTHDGSYITIKAHLETTDPKTVASLFGIHEGDLVYLSQRTPWKDFSRLNQLRATLDAVTYGALHLIGLTRYEVSAEHIASVVAILVAPVNRMAACALYEPPRTSQQIVDESDTQRHALPGVTSVRLYAMCTQLARSDAAWINEWHAMTAAIGELPQETPEQ